MGQMLETPGGTRIPLGTSGYLAKQLLSLRPRVSWYNLKDLFQEILRAQ